METIKNKVKALDNKGTMQQDITYKDAYGEVRERLVRRGNQAVITEVERKPKK